METSRDDFVIAIRSAFLKKSNKQRFSLIVLIFFSIVLLILGKFNFSIINSTKIIIKEGVYRASFIISTPENFLKKTYYNIDSHFKLYDDYIDNRKKLQAFKVQKLENDFILSENIRLKKLINDYVISSEETIAKVLIDKKSPFLRSIVLNKGSKNNIKLGMAVLDSNYLVGKIVEVNYLTSRALLLSDLNSKIPVSIEPGNIQSILSGSGKNEGTIQYLKKETDLEDESIVYSSGSGGIFKEGVPIGKINIQKTEISVEKKEKNNITVNFFSDFSQLQFVKIVVFKKDNN
ncbi:rod shape-determining protein MreC [Candidatus Pelagibacter sp.]|nr:rod shape-determining protein MreC [Candidatus Pelagibacter sp.]